MRLRILALASLSTALPQTPPTNTKIIAIEPFNVTSFTAAAIVLSNRVSYHFTVTTTPTSPPVNCSVLGTTLSEELSSIPLTWCSKDDKVAWQWTKRDDGSGIHDLVVRREVEGEKIVEEGRYIVPKDDTPWLGTGRFRRQVYEGPKDFVVPAFRYVSEE